MPIKLYDLVAQKGVNASLFSPATIRARLALVQKRVPFETVEVSYHDLRFYWTPKLGVQKATAPLLELEDGTVIMDSLKIIEWLDRTYPDRPSLYLPETAPPIDVDSAAYRSAVADFEAWRDSLTIPKPLFAVYAPLVVPKFDDETAAYWASDERLGQKGTWDAINNRDPSGV
ncbi:hypothetical protein BCR35DRAFT_309037 [Leucosporidium creatinivorum]|uniref:GST N-terminal domain-containing protein n=1 Tax=Leucosporidium creatinivorum TaxID=106004 RepID=A0A1Y2DRY4_9BASI|nr:hypothetical protein BCR35DRAFT_309037 [Leucosporidium creatinivorum]